MLEIKNLFRYFVVIIILALTKPVYAATHARIFIDAGSSGSRLHLFTYEPYQENFALHDIFSDKITPGLATFSDKPPHEIAQYLKPLFDRALQKVHSLHINPKHVSVSILGTAGMRLLPQQYQSRTYQIIQQYLKTNYPFPITKIETISGKMEALYGWLDINYLAKTFEQQTESLGSIDMGGASTQIAFENADLPSSINTVHLNINHRSYTIFVKSFMSFGMDQARQKMAKSTTANLCFPMNYPRPDKKGNFNFIKCKNMYANLLKENHISHALIPNSKHKFVAYSGIFYTYKTFAALQNVKQQFIETQIKNFCTTKTWAWWQQNFATETTKNLPNYCANMTYLYYLLYHIYQIKADNLMVTNKINNQDIDWTLGALFHQLLHENFTNNNGISE